MRNKPAPRLLEELESRILMSVTVAPATLTADQNAIVAARTAYSSAIVSLGASLVSGSQTLESQLPAGKSNLALAKKAISAEKKVLSAVKKETTKFGDDSVSLGAKAVAAGNADIAKPSTKADAKVHKAGLLLLNKTSADRTKISNDQSLTNLYADLNNIVIANPGATAFAAGVQELENAVPINAPTTAGADLQLAVNQLTIDLGIVAT